MKLLALDTASGQCSVALLSADGLVVQEVATARDHAQLILPMVDAVLAEAGFSLRQLDGIAFGRGPGSFTGVRVAAAVTQGLALGADLPVLPVSDLRALAQQALRQVQCMGGGRLSGAVLACMDARMGEVYWALCAARNGQVTVGECDEHVTAPENVRCNEIAGVCAAAGKGLAAWPLVAQTLQIPMTHVFAGAEPSARDIASLAARDIAAGSNWVDPAMAQPVYLRDDVAKPAPGRAL